MKKTLFSLMLLTCTFTISNAQSLDESFGTNGLVTHTDIGNWFEAVELTNGKVILSGEYNNGAVSKAVMVKLNPDGTLDTSFGTGGKFIMDETSDYSYYEEFSKPVILPDGKLLFAHASVLDIDSNEETANVKLLRLNANGSLDNTFVGYSLQDLTEDEFPYGLFSLPSGKILLYGSNYLMRFNANGTLDTTYSNNGKRTLSFEIEEMYMNGSTVYLWDYYGKKLIKLNDESANISKTYSFEGDVYFYKNYFYFYNYDNGFTTIKKIDQEFNPVNSFGNNGTSIFNEDIGYNLIFQPMGSIIVTSNDYEYDNDGNVIYYFNEYRRVNPDGSLDTTFGTNGVYKIIIPESAPFHSYSDDYVHSNGKLYHLLGDKNYESNNIYLKRTQLPSEILATSSTALNNKLKIIQNPVKELLQLSDTLFNAQIFDITGKNTGIKFEGKQVSLSNMKPGVYIVSGVTKSGDKVSLKFIKL